MGKKLWEIRCQAVTGESKLLTWDEIEDEKKWAENFANSQDQLAQLSEEAIADFKQGKTQPLNF